MRTAHLWTKLRATGARHCHWRRPARVIAALAFGALAVPAVAAAHGGISIAEGGGGGVRIAVHGSDASPEEVDFATTLAGPGTGQGSRVVYWVRPQGRSRSFRIATERDEGGIHHAEIPTAGRGSWQDWDVSAYVTLNDDKRLRVTSDREDPPGPPERRRADDAAPQTGTAPAPTTTSATEPTSTDGVEDVSGEGDGMPSWAIPSIVALALVGLVAIVIRNRRLPPDSPE